MALPCDLRRSEPHFADSWAACSFEANLPAGEFDGKVLAAVRLLLEKPPSAGTRQAHSSKVERVAVNPGYRLVYRWSADYDASGNAILQHLELLLVEGN